MNVLYYVYVYNISKCTHRIRSMKRERYRFEIVMFVIVCYINIFDIHTDACQTAQHSFTDEYIRISNKIASPFYFLFHTFVWAVRLIGSFDAQSLCCVRSICLILSDRCQVENLVSIGLVCVLYFISCMKDKRCTHFSHRYFFPFILQLYISSWKLVCGLLIFETCAPFDVSQFDGFGCSIGVVLCSARVQMLGIIIQHQQM